MRRMLGVSLVVLFCTTRVIAGEIIPEAFRGTWTEVQAKGKAQSKLEVKAQSIVWTRDEVGEQEITVSTNYTLIDAKRISFPASIVGSRGVFTPEKVEGQATVTITLNERGLVLTVPEAKIDQGAYIQTLTPLTRIYTREALRGQEESDALAISPEIHNVIEKLKSANPGTRQEAVDTLKRIGPSSIPALIEVMKNAKEDMARVGAAVVLSGFGAQGEPAVPILAKTLTNDSSHIVRALSALAIGAVGDKAKTAIPSLTKALDDPVEMVVQCALGALGSVALETPSLVPKVKAIADDPQRTKGTRELAQSTLAKVSGSAQAPSSNDSKQAQVAVVVEEAFWITGDMLNSLQPKPDSGKQLLMLKIEIENKGETDLVLAEEGDIQMVVTRNEPSAKQEIYSVKGICIGQELMWVGLPKGVQLQTKAGWVSSVSLDPKEQNIGTHHFFGVGSYRLTIEPGGKMKLPVLFDLPIKAEEMGLVLVGMSPVKVLPTK